MNLPPYPMAFLHPMAFQPLDFFLKKYIIQRVLKSSGAMMGAFSGVYTPGDNIDAAMYIGHMLKFAMISNGIKVHIHKIAVNIL
jgi:hypothetical protein